MKSTALQPIRITVPAGERQAIPVAGCRFFAFKEASEGKFEIGLDESGFVPWDAGMGYALPDGEEPISVLNIWNRGDDPIVFEIIAGAGRVYDQRLTVITNRIGDTIASDGVDGTGITPPTGGNGIRGWLSGVYARLAANGPLGLMLDGLEALAQSILTGVGTISSQLPASLGQKAKTASLPVVLPSDQTVPVSSPAAVVSVTPTVSTTPVYTSGDVIGGKITLANAVAVSAGASLLHQIQLMDRANQKPEGSIIVFNADPTAATLTDNTALALSTDDAKVVAVIPVVAANWVTLNTKAFATLSNLGCAVKAASGTSLYAAFVTTSTPTFAATSNLQISFSFLPVNT